MGLEVPTYINQLNAAWPLDTDLRSQGDDHLRAIKTALLNSFPGITGAVSRTHTEINTGVTAALAQMSYGYVYCAQLTLLANLSTTWRSWTTIGSDVPDDGQAAGTCAISAGVDSRITLGATGTYDVMAQLTIVLSDPTISPVLGIMINASVPSYTETRSSDLSGGKQVLVTRGIFNLTSGDILRGAIKVESGTPTSNIQDARLIVRRIS